MIQSDGTAYFLKHIFFLSTDNYPFENEYSLFMTNNEESNNAYTSLINTNYHFYCSNETFYEGLEFFAKFLIFLTFSKSPS